MPALGPPGGPLPPALAATVVFVASGAVLVLEILAVRLLAPYVGLTLEAYTTIIGVCLAGISAGSFLGGRLADAQAPRPLLGPILVVGGLLGAATLPLVRGLGEMTDGTAAEGLVLLGLVAFFPPAAVLSMTTPVVAKLQLATLGETGSVVGRLSAIATLGGLVGTFGTGFVLVAAVPLAPIVLGLGATLAVLGGVLAASRVMLLAAVVGALVLTGAGIAVGSPCETESAYFCGRVVEDPERPSGRTLLLDDLQHAYVDLEDPRRLEFRYVRIIGDVIDALPPGPLRALHVGGGGFTLPRYIAATRPGSSSRVLEVDPEVVALARRRLGLETGPRLSVRVGDARVNLRREPSRRYDVVVGDAFGSLAVPWHLTTREFLRDVRRVLRPGGVYALNLIDQGPLRFARAEARTLRGVFEHVALVAQGAPGGDGLAGGNLVFLASRRPLPLAELRARWPERVLSGPALAAFAAGAEELRDGYAPVDQLLTPATG